MRILPDELAARLESGAARMCHAWIVTLRDGTRLGFTDHDRDLEVSGTWCRAGCGWTAGAAHQELGLEAGQASASGVLEVSGPDLEAVLAGRWDGARVSLWRVDWSAPDLGVLLSGGLIRKLLRDGERLTLEMEGPLALLGRMVGRTYGRLCDAILGDERCGLDLGSQPDAVCDKRFTTCRDRFANTINFRGFPDIPGDDFLVARPTAGGRHDGGSRR